MQVNSKQDSAWAGEQHMNSTTGEAGAMSYEDGRAQQPTYSVWDWQEAAHCHTARITRVTLVLTLAIDQAHSRDLVAYGLDPGPL